MLMALPKVTYEYVTDILPYVATGSDGTTGQDDVEDAPGYFELNKAFIKRAQVKDHKDGSVSFTILIKFKKILPTGGEVQDDAVTNPLGVAPEAMKEPVRPERKEAVAPKAKKEPVRPEVKEAVAPEAKKEPVRPEEKEAVEPEAKKEPVRLEEKEVVQETASPEVPKPMAKEGKEALRVNKLVVTKILRKLPDEGKQEEQKDEQKMEHQAEGGKKEEQKDEQKMEQQAEGGKKEDQKDEQKKVEQKEGGKNEDQKKEHKMEDRKEGGKKEEHISRKMREKDPVMSKILYYKRVGATNELVPIPEPTRAEYYIEAVPEPPRSTRRESSGTILILTPPAALLGQIPNIPAAAAAQTAQSSSGKTSPAPPPEERKRRRATPAAAHSRLASGMTYNAMMPDARE
ncbi:unnamed protein product [Orchesella dallaii]|uniref:Uncharacterized protein n=1 Tax=Orchesella dallaii TaxID=48710 RepID=A0ABP1RIX4_9HEXA